MVGLGGLEPPTLRLSGARSNHLSYRPSTDQRSVRRTDSFRKSKSTDVRPLKTRQQAQYRDDCEADLFDRAPERALAPRIEPEGPTECRGLRRKEVIQPQVPLRLPCYDFTPVTNHSLGGCLLAVGAPTSGAIGSHGVTGGVYKARERIHPGMLIRDY